MVPPAADAAGGIFCALFRCAPCRLACLRGASEALAPRPLGQRAKEDGPCCSPQSRPILVPLPFISLITIGYTLAGGHMKFGESRPQARSRDLIFRGWWARRVDEHNIVYERPDERKLELGGEEGLVLNEQLLEYLLSEVRKYPGTSIAFAEVWAGSRPLRPEEEPSDDRIDKLESENTRLDRLWEMNVERSLALRDFLSVHDLTGSVLAEMDRLEQEIVE